MEDKEKIESLSEEEDFDFDDFDLDMSLLDEMIDVGAEDEELYFDTSDRILKLQDRLAEDIVLENIEEQLDADLDPLSTKLNYVKLYRERFESESDPLDADYLLYSAGNVGSKIAELIDAKFNVLLGDDLDYISSAEYLRDLETLYEFLFVRQYENIFNYFYFKLTKEKDNFLQSYRPLMESEENSKDVFVNQGKKKFVNEDDVIILHFMNEIIDDIISESQSAYEMFSDIVHLDLFEEYNNQMNDLLENYGDKIVLNNDSLSAELFLAPVAEKTEARSVLKNDLVMKYLETCEIVVE